MAADRPESRGKVPAIRIAWSILLLCAGYYFAGFVGLISRFPSSGISTLWPATAVLLVALLVTRPRQWWLLVLALLPAHLHLVWTFQGPVPLAVMLTQFAGNVGHALLVAVAMRHLVDVSDRFEDLRSMVVFIVVAAIMSSWVVSAIVVYLFQVLGWVDDYWLAWRGRSLSNGLGTLLVTPLVLWGVSGGLSTAFAAPARRKIEFGVVIAGLIAVGVPVLNGYGSGSPLLPLALLPLLLWAAVRFGPAGLCFTLLLIAMLTLSGAIAGRGPFIAKSPIQNTLDLQLFLFATAIPLMLLSALVQERYRSMSELQKSEARYRAVVEDQTELICRFLPDGTYTFVNEAYCRYFRTTPEALLGHNFWVYIPEEDHPPLRELLASLSRERPVATIEHEVIAPGGQIRWQQWSDRAFFDEQGRIVDFQAVGRDITASKLAEEEHRQFEVQRQAAATLRESEARFRQLADAMPQIVWTADSEGTVDYFNRKWYALTGAAEAQTGDQSWLPFVHPDDRSRCFDLWYQCVRSGEPLQAEIRIRQSVAVDESEYRWYLARALPVREDSGKVVRWYGTCTDVHDRKLAEEALRESETRLTDANLSKDRFLAALSHELRTPLTPVLLAAEAHRNNQSLPDELRRDLNTIYTNAALEVALIDDLLDLTRVERGKIELNTAPLDVHALLEDTALTCSDATFLNKGLSMSLELGAKRHWVMGDSTRLSQVFWNIIKNSVKFSDLGALITIRTSDGEGAAGNSDGTPGELTLVIEFSDTGFGIEPSEMTRIFEPFEQGGRDITRRFGGMGLGLALSKNFVELHGGRIWAASRGRHAGATIRVELPAMAAAPQGPIPPATARESLSRTLSPAAPAVGKPADASGARILLVEDHEITASLLSRLLRTYGYQVLKAHGVVAALELAARHEIDLVISDLGLPDGTGMELMSRLAREHGLRGIALSGYGMEDDLRQSRAAGFVEHLVKPVTVERVRVAIDRALSDSLRPPPISVGSQAP